MFSLSENKWITQNITIFSYSLFFAADDTRRKQLLPILTFHTSVMLQMVLGTNNRLILSTAQSPLWWKAQKVKFSQDTLGKNVVQKLTNNPGMTTTELSYKTAELTKTAGTLLLSFQTFHFHQHQLQLHVHMKERTDPTTCQASLLVMEVLKREYAGTLFRFLAEPM